MKILTEIETTEDGEIFFLYINHECVLRIGDSLSINAEDAILNRDLKFVFSIKDWLKAAYDAGKNGEEFSVFEIKTKAL